MGIQRGASSSALFCGERARRAPCHLRFSIGQGRRVRDQSYGQATTRSSFQAKAHGRDIEGAEALGGLRRRGRVGRVARSRMDIPREWTISESRIGFTRTIAFRKQGSNRNHPYANGRAALESVLPANGV